MLGKSSRLTLFISCGVFAIGLGLFAYMGFYNRYWADDWCYNRDFKTLGLAGTLKGYFFTGEDASRGYSTNRYSLTLLSGLLYIPGMFGTQILAGLVIAAWLVGLLWVLSNLSKIYGDVLGIVAFLGGVCLLYYDLYISPSRFQILYWRSGVHYSFAIISGLYMIGLITSQVAGGRMSKAVNYSIVPLAFLGGGLSEIGSAYLVSGMALLLMAALYGKRKHAVWAMKSYSAILVAFVSLLASMAVLILSPSNSRASMMSVRPTAWLLIPRLSLEYSFSFIVNSIRSLPVPHLVFLSFFAFLSILSGFVSTGGNPASVRNAALYLFVIAVVVFLLVAAIQAPNVRFYSAPPDPRGQSLSRFTMLAGIALAAWIVGQVLVHRWHADWLVRIAWVGLAFGAIYTAHLIATNYAELPGFIERAQLWDQRDTDIRNAEAQGLRMVGVQVIDTHSITVHDILRSRDMNGEWVTNCGSEYYGLDAIRAIQP